MLCLWIRRNTFSSDCIKYILKSNKTIVFYSLGCNGKDVLSYGKNVSIPGHVNLMCDHHMNIWWFVDTVSFSGLFAIFHNRLSSSFKLGNVAPRYCDCIILFYSVNPQIHGKCEIIRSEDNSEWMWVRALGTINTCHITNYAVTTKLYICCDVSPFLAHPGQLPRSRCQERKSLRPTRGLWDWKWALVQWQSVAFVLHSCVCRVVRPMSRISATIANVTAM